ncbi:hypothetical protein [Novosphingobium endophyticum]|uniref:hypothetical protein n=1 Tax=Novosphingobium endophyticum TaxID=1955250 RepID=UPI001669426A|nr:hypothetical protein [Novosphingobium endophyticum]
MRDIIFKLAPLPPLEKRRSGFIPPKWFLPVYRPERDADYLLGKLLNFVFLTTFLLLGAILLDAHLYTGFLIDASEFRHNKLLLPATFSRLISLPLFVLALLFYLRIRLGIDISRDDIPVGGRKAWALTLTRRKWIEVGLLILVGSLACIFASHLFVIQVTLHYQQQDNLAFVLLPQAFAVVAMIGGPIYLILGALLLEKAIRCFDVMHDNLRRNYEFAQKDISDKQQ